MTVETGSESFFLAQHQAALLESVLDRIIPRDAGFPGAGELGMAWHIDRVAGGRTDLKRLFSSGLAQVELVSHRRYSAEFTALTDEQKDTVLLQVESQAPAFFNELVRQTYNAYYTHPRVLGLLGLEVRPPQPRGHHVEPLDLGLLEGVKRRGKAYRDA